MPFETVKIHKKAGIQSIQIPEDMRIEDDTVYLKKVGNSIYVIPFHNPWESLIMSSGTFTEDFMKERIQLEVEERETFE